MWLIGAIRIAGLNKGGIEEIRSQAGGTDPSLFCAECSALRTANVSCWKAEIETISKGPTPAPTKSHQVDCMAVVCKLECMGNLTAVEKKYIYVEVEYRHGLLGRVGNQTLAAGFRSSAPLAQPRDFGCAGNGHRLLAQTPAQVHASRARSSGSLRLNNNNK